MWAISDQQSMVIETIIVGGSVAKGRVQAGLENGGGSRRISNAGPMPF